MSDKDIADTTPEFWDCECPEKYIHRKMFISCSKCRSVRDDQPDSRLSELGDPLRRACDRPEVSIVVEAGFVREVYANISANVVVLDLDSNDDELESIKSLAEIVRYKHDLGEVKKIY